MGIGGTMADQAAAPEQVDPFELFSEQTRLAVRGLTYIGHLEKEVEFCGHTFRMRTLYPSEKAAISIIVQPWRGSISEGEVWANAQVALSLQSVDHEDDFCQSVGPDLNDFAKARLNYATKQWYQPTLSFLYARYLELEQEALDGIRELQDFSERNRVPSPPSPDSLTEPDTLGAPTDSDIQP
jgi:hypothetical protein